MKQPKQNSPVKSARKTAKTELKERVLSTLKNMFEKEKIKVTKKVKKRSAKLVKTITKELGELKPVAEKAVKGVKTAVNPKPVKKAVKEKAAEPVKETVVAEKSPAKTKKTAATKTTAEKN
jgi:hypothetical protein